MAVLPGFSPPQDYIFPFCNTVSSMHECKVPITKDARLGITAKLLPLGLEIVDVLADGNCFLHAAGFALLQLKNGNFALMPTVATIRAEEVRFLTNARLNVIMDERTLDEACGGMEDPVTLGQRSTNRQEQYDSWSKYITHMKKPDTYADTLFVFGLSTLYNISVRNISDINDEPQLFSVGFTEPTDVITVCFLQLAEHYHTFREIATTTTEVHLSLFEHQQDMDTSEVTEVTEKEYASPIYTTP